MNNFENVDLTYYGENVYINQNKEYHAMQNKIKRYLQFLVDTMLNDEMEKKSIEANDFILDLMDVITNISIVKNYDGSYTKLIISDKYIIFDYFRNEDNKIKSRKVIIDKENNEFNFINNPEDLLINMTEYSITSEGIKKYEFESVPAIFMLNDETISDSIDEIKNQQLDRRITI